MKATKTAFPSLPFLPLSLPQLPRRILRLVAVPLLCALFALSGVASARSGGEKRADPAHAALFSLCLSSGEAGTDIPPDHDCGACCLTFAAALPPPPVFAIFPVPVERTQPRLSGGDRKAPRALPWSRGPPSVA